MSQFNNRSNLPDNNNIESAMFADCISNSREIFKLIDSILPLESCLHYEVLPLNLKANHFSLGMLNPQNQDALNFIRSIANAFHYTLDIQLIDAQTHQLLLANYLQNPPPEQIKETDHHQTIVEPNFGLESSSQPNELPKSRRLSDSAPTIISQPQETPSQFHSKPKVELPMPLRDLPPDLDFLRDLSDQPVEEPLKSNIDAQTHQLILENYLKNPTPDKIRERDHDQTIVEPNFGLESSSQPSELPKSRRLSDSAPTIISQPQETPSQPHSKPSVELPMPLRDLPPDLDFLRDLSDQPVEAQPKSNIDASKTLVDFPLDFDLLRDLPQQSKRRLPKSPVDVSMTVTEIPQEFRQQGQPINLDEKPNESEIIFSEAQISNLIRETENSRNNLEINNLSILELQAEFVPKSTDFLADLTWELSWQELLDKALNSQVDQLHLERYSDRGKITASKDEITQSSLDQIPLPIFCSAIDQIKKIAKLSTSAIEKPSKVILEKLHQQERILLRLEFIPNSYGEKVIVQILRDKALKAYEQKQMDKISEQALSLAQQLEKTLRKIQVCFESAEFTNLRELQGVQNRINQQLKLLDK